MRTSKLSLLDRFSIMTNPVSSETCRVAALAEEVERTVRAIYSLSDPSPSGVRDLRNALPETAPPDSLTQRTLIGRLDALSDAASFEAACSRRGTLLQLMLALRSLVLLTGIAVDRSLSAEDRDTAAKEGPKAERLLYSAINAMFSEADEGLSCLHQWVCPPEENPITAIEAIMTLATE